MTAGGDAVGAVDEGLGRHRNALRPAAVTQLLRLRRAGELRTAHIRPVAHAAGVHMRTVWSWLARAEETGSTEKPEPRRFQVTDDFVEVLADHQGNVKRAHRHLVRAAEAVGAPQQIRSPCFFPTTQMITDGRTRLHTAPTNKITIRNSSKKTVGRGGHASSFSVTMFCMLAPRAVSMAML